MKRYFIFIILAMCFFLNSTAQEKVQKRIAPKEDVKGNREYDEKGNLIKFDSVYSYSWSGDTTLMKSFSPDDFPNPFGDHFGSLSDSTFQGNSFFDHFEQLFAQPFSGTQDSILLKEFGMNPHFHDFQFNTDSLSLNFRNFGENKGDSISSKSPGHLPFRSHPRSVDEMMKMLQQQMQEMEGQQRNFFKEEPKWKEF